MLVIEQELKAQKEPMAEKFAAVDRRLEATDKRFEDIHQRFFMLQWMWGGGILVNTTVMRG